ncbi:hypothetical protein EDB92DRAFT_1835733 [Lactarius akahatsu]|uniref:Uncharacterized protein n=1 Tax=Lactarius akahatsu TaxID=416441 RepID=A0AAD4QEC0_9AGAM|nr:hypothetical protein EDB92DRAFT_1835733 [Lactarius akahatsu]
MAPLAGRPPFATDEPDSVYATSHPQARYRQPPKEDPNARTSAYNHYDGYLNNGYDDSSHGKPAALAPSVQPVPQQAPVPLLAPKPGYAAPIAALSMPQSSPSPEAAQFPPGINPPLARPDQHGAPRMPPAVVRARPPPVAPIAVPSTPHPLPPTMTPILPVFARPAQPTQANEVKWGPEPILRGNSEEKLIPRRGEKGDDFWRRFSMIAKEENTKRYSQKLSPWLRETQGGKKRMSGWVWVIGLIIFACAGLGIGLGLYISHKSPSHQDPTAFGGGGNHGTGPTTTSQATDTGAGSHSLSRHVSPTNTVARRAAFADALPTPMSGAPIHVVHVSLPRWDAPGAPRARHQRRHLNRALV